MAFLVPLSLHLRLLIIGVATGVATVCGGVIALRIRSRLYVLTAFGGGAMMGVALADLLPEALALSQNSHEPLPVTTLVLAGFMAYMTLSRLRAGILESSFSRSLGPASLVAHSVMDGLGIGLAFSVSQSAGILVATAVLSHDLVDGSNTVMLSLSSDQRRSRAWIWLSADAVAPIGGIELSRLIAPSPTVLAPLLALFAGFFLYIATVELLPKAVAGGGLLSSSVATLSGAILVVAIVSIGRS